MTEQIAGTIDTESAAEPAIAHLLQQVAHALQQRLVPTLREHGLTAEHWQILSVLLRRPGTGMSDLAAEALLPAATLTRHMDRLVERALVVRRVDPEDKRRVVAALSSRGARIAADVRALEGRIEQDVVAVLDRARLSELAVGLRAPTA